MTTMKQCVEHLSSEIGARPAGTDEEQSAAIFIKDTLLENTSMDVDLEEFEASFSGELFRGAEAALVFLAGMISILAPTALVFSLFIALVGCVLFVLDELEIFKLSSYFSKQPSQNVVAKHIPAKSGETKRRSRKIVVITNYDSEKIRPQVKSGFFKYLGYAKIFELASTVVVFLMLLLNLLTGGNTFFTILTIICTIGSVLPLLAYLFHTTSHYNDGANNNAASVAVMMDVAKRLSTGVYRSAGDTPVIHGREIAESLGVIPDETNVVWEAEPNFESEDSNEATSQERAVSKDTGRVQVESSNEAIHGGKGVAALFRSDSHQSSEASPSISSEDITKPVEEKSEATPQASEKQKQPIEFKMQQAETHAQIPSATGTPDWFSRGKERAKEDRPERTADKGVKRSVYGDALSAANAPITQSPTSSDVDKPRVKSDLEKQLDAIHSQIEKSGRAAEDKVRKDASVAEKVLENEELARKAEAEKKAAEKKVEDVEEPAASEVLTDPAETAEVTLRDTSGDTIAQPPLSVDDVKAEFNSQKSNEGELSGEQQGASESAKNVAAQIPSLASSAEPEVHIRENTEVREPLQKLDNIVKKPTPEEISDLQPVPRDILESHTASQEKLAKAQSGRSPIDERLAAKGITRAQTLTPRSNNLDQNVGSTSKRDIQLPSLTGAIQAQKEREEKKNSEAAEADSKKEMHKAASGIMVPSLSSASDSADKSSENQKVANAGAFGVGEATGTFEPITDDLVAGLSEEETYVLDADDTIFEEHTTESGVVTGPGYVDIPETRTESVFGKIFNRKKKKSEEEGSLSEAYGVDENYDATDLANERGDWSTFSEDDDEWNGGVAYAEVPDEEVEQPKDTEEEKEYPRDDVYNFADNNITTEVWCVALGAQYASHAGLNNFMMKHKEELKGSIFVVLDGLGCGATKLVETEGVIKRHTMSARMKRIARSSAKNVGVDLGSDNMTWCESLASNIANSGFSTIHLAGYEADRPALLSSEEDVAENVDETICQENANLVMEIVRSI